MQFWKGGRLAWPPVIAIAIICLSTVAADLVWRVFPISIFVAVGGTALFVVLALIVLGLLARRFA